MQLPIYPAHYLSICLLFKADCIIVHYTPNFLRTFHWSAVIVVPTWLAGDEVAPIVRTVLPVHVS